MLVIGADKPALVNHRGSIESKAFMAAGVTNDQVQVEIGREVHQAVQSLFALTVKRWAQQQIFRRVADQGQLRRKKNTGTGGMGAACGLGQFVHIAMQIAYDEI